MQKVEAIDLTDRQKIALFVGTKMRKNRMPEDIISKTLKKVWTLRTEYNIKFK